MKPSLADTLARLILSELRGTKAQREWAQAEIAQHGAVLLERFCAALREESPSGRAAAAEALGRTGDARAIRPLLAALRDPQEWVRWAAATALGSLGKPAIPVLSEALHDPSPTVRSLAAMALGQTGEPDAVEPLREALGDAAWPVRQAAIQALERLGASQAVPDLCRAIADPHLRVRVAAAQALGRVGDVRALDSLGQAAQSADWELRCAAAESFKHLLTRLVPNPQAEALASLRRLDRRGLDPDLRRAVRQAIQRLQAWLQETEGHIPARALSRSADTPKPLPGPASLSPAQPDEEGGERVIW